MNKQKYMSTVEAAEQLDITPRTVRRYVKRGHIKAFKLDPKNPRSELHIERKSVEEILSQLGD